MPNIREFTSPIDTIHPTEMGSSAYELEGRHIGADIDIAGRYIGGAITSVGEQMEKVDTRAKTVEMYKDLTDQRTKNQLDLETAVKGGDPNDHNILTDWWDKNGQPAYDKLADKYSSNPLVAARFAEEVARNQQELFMHGLGLQNELAGRQAQMNRKDTVVGLSNAANRSPELVNDQLGVNQRNVETMVHSGAIPASLAEGEINEGNRQIVHAAAQGIVTNVISSGARASDAQIEAAQAILKDTSNPYQKYADPNFLGEQMNRLADFRERLPAIQEHEENARITREERATTLQARRGQSAIIDEVLQQPVGADGRFIPPPNMAGLVAALPDDASGIKLTMSRWVETLQRPQQLRSDSAVKSDFVGRQFIQEGQPRYLSDNELLAAHATGKIVDRDFTEIWKNRKAAQADSPADRLSREDIMRRIASRKGFLTHSNELMGKQDPLGDQKWGDFQGDSIGLWQSEHAAGKSNDEIIKDLDALIPAYRPYANATELEQALTNGITSIRGPMEAGPRGVPAAKPTYQHGEKAEDFLRRLEAWENKGGK